MPVQRKRKRPSRLPNRLKIEADEDIDSRSGGGMKPRLLLVEDFLLPNLVSRALGIHLCWVSEDEHVFALSRMHGSKASWSEEYAKPAIIWTKLKNLWDERDPKNVVKAKHRLACAMRKHPNIIQVGKPEGSIHFQLKMKSEWLELLVKLNQESGYSGYTGVDSETYSAFSNFCLAPLAVPEQSTVARRSRSETRTTRRRISPTPKKKKQSPKRRSPSSSRSSRRYRRGGKNVPSDGAQLGESQVKVEDTRENEGNVLSNEELANYSRVRYGLRAVKAINYREPPDRVTANDFFTVQRTPAGSSATSTATAPEPKLDNQKKSKKAVYISPKTRWPMTTTTAAPNPRRETTRKKKRNKKTKKTVKEERMNNGQWRPIDYCDGSTYGCVLHNLVFQPEQQQPTPPPSPDHHLIPNELGFTVDDHQPVGLFPDSLTIPTFPPAVQLEGAELDDEFRSSCMSPEPAPSYSVLEPVEVPPPDAFQLGFDDVRVDDGAIVLHDILLPNEQDSTFALPTYSEPSEGVEVEGVAVAAPRDDVDDMWTSASNTTTAATTNAVVSWPSVPSCRSRSRPNILRKTKPDPPSNLSEGKFEEMKSPKKEEKEVNQFDTNLSTSPVTGICDEWFPVVAEFLEENDAEFKPVAEFLATQRRRKKRASSSKSLRCLDSSPHIKEEPKEKEIPVQVVKSEKTDEDFTVVASAVPEDVPSLYMSSYQTLYQHEAGVTEAFATSCMNSGNPDVKREPVVTVNNPTPSPYPVNVPSFDTDDDDQKFILDLDLPVGNVEEVTTDENPLDSADESLTTTASNYSCNVIPPPTWPLKIESDPWSTGGLLTRPPPDSQVVPEMTATHPAGATAAASCSFPPADQAPTTTTSWNIAYNGADGPGATNRDRNLNGDSHATGSCHSGYHHTGVDDNSQSVHRNAPEEVPGVPSGVRIKEEPIDPNDVYSIAEARNDYALPIGNYTATTNNSFDSVFPVSPLVNDNSNPWIGGYQVPGNGRNGRNGAINPATSGGSLQNGYSGLGAAAQTAYANHDQVAGQSLVSRNYPSVSNSGSGYHTFRNIDHRRQSFENSANIKTENGQVERRNGVLDDDEDCIRSCGTWSDCTVDYNKRKFKFL